MPTTIEKELIILLIVDLFFHVINSGEMVNVSQNSEVVRDVVAALES